MRKALLTLAVLLMALSGYARDLTPRIGIVAGANLSNFSSGYFTSRLGYHLGVRGEMSLGNQGTYLDAAMLFSLKGGKVKGSFESKNDVTAHFNAYYLELPIHIGYKTYFHDELCMFISAGPYIGLGLFGKSDLSIFGMKDKWDTFSDETLPRMDYGVGANIGLEFQDKYRIALGYDFGLRPLDGGSNMRSTSVKSRNLMLTFGVNF